MEYKLEILTAWLAALAVSVLMLEVCPETVDSKLEILTAWLAALAVSAFNCEDCVAFAAVKVFSVVVWSAAFEKRLVIKTLIAVTLELINPILFSCADVLAIKESRSALCELALETNVVSVTACVAALLNKVVMFVVAVPKFALMVLILVAWVAAFVCNTVMAALAAVMFALIADRFAPIAEFDNALSILTSTYEIFALTLTKLFICNA